MACAQSTSNTYLLQGVNARVHAVGKQELALRDWPKHLHSLLSRLHGLLHRVEVHPRRQISSAWLLQRESPSSEPNSVPAAAGAGNTRRRGALPLTQQSTAAMQSVQARPLLKEQPHLESMDSFVLPYGVQRHLVRAVLAIVDQERNAIRPVYAHRDLLCDGHRFCADLNRARPLLLLRRQPAESSAQNGLRRLRAPWRETVLESLQRHSLVTRDECWTRFSAGVTSLCPRCVPGSASAQRKSDADSGGVGGTP